MHSYNHPLLTSMDFSNRSNPVLAMLDFLQQEGDSFDFEAHLANPFQTPFLKHITDIQLDATQRGLELFHGDTLWKKCSIPGGQVSIPTQGGGVFLPAVIDPVSQLAGGYCIENCIDAVLTLDQTVWEDHGRPLDGRGFLLKPEEPEKKPFVMSHGKVFFIGQPDDFDEKGGWIYFPDQQILDALEQDSLITKFIPFAQMECIRPFDLQVVEAVRCKPGWEDFSLNKWIEIRSELEQQYRAAGCPALLRLADVGPVALWGFLDKYKAFQLGAQIPDQGLFYLDGRPGEYGAPFGLIKAYQSASKKSVFYEKYGKAALSSAFQMICDCLGIPNNLRVVDAWYAASWAFAEDIWFGKGRSRLAKVLMDSRITPDGLAGPNGHLFSDASVAQWLPADFEVTDQNRVAFKTFLHGVANDLRDLTPAQVAQAFQQSLCSPAAKAVDEWEDLFEEPMTEIQLLDLINGGYFETGCWRFDEVEKIPSHFVVLTDGSKADWTELYCDNDVYPFILKSNVRIEDFVFRMAAVQKEYFAACLYCDLPPRTTCPEAGRIPPVIIHHANAPRVPIGVVNPLSTEFELSEEFYDTLSEPRGEFNERFKQIVEQYWDIFDKKYPYLY